MALFLGCIHVFTHITFLNSLRLNIYYVMVTLSGLLYDVKYLIAGIRYMYVGRFAYPHQKTLERQMHYTNFFKNKLTACLKYKLIEVHEIGNVFAIHVGNVQNMNPVQDCTGFIFYTFHTDVHLK